MGGGGLGHNKGVFELCLYSSNGFNHAKQWVCACEYDDSCSLLTISANILNNPSGKMMYSGHDPFDM